MRRALIGIGVLAIGALGAAGYDLYGAVAAAAPARLEIAPPRAPARSPVRPEIARAIAQLLAAPVPRPAPLPPPPPAADAVRGTVVDGDGERLAGVTVVVAQPDGTAQAVITDEAGAYELDHLRLEPTTRVTYYYLNATLDATAAEANADDVTIDVDLASVPDPIVDTAPAIDPTSTVQGLAIDRDSLHDISVPGRTFEAALGAAAGAQDDASGEAFVGVSTLTNVYYVDGAPPPPE